MSLLNWRWVSTKTDIANSLAQDIYILYIYTYYIHIIYTHIHIHIYAGCGVQLEVIRAVEFKCVPKETEGRFGYFHPSLWRGTQRWKLCKGQGRRQKRRGPGESWRPQPFAGKRTERNPDMDSRRRLFPAEKSSCICCDMTMEPTSLQWKFQQVQQPCLSSWWGQLKFWNLLYLTFFVIYVHKWLKFL